MKYIFFFILMLFGRISFAQKNTQAQLFKAFAAVCNDYKQKMPLQLTLEYRKYSNLIVSPGDSTSVMEGTFFISPNISYINFGGIEQIVTDSLILIVMNSIRQMSLSVNAADSVTGVGIAMNDRLSRKAIDRMKGLFSIEQGFADSRAGLLSLKSKKAVYTTSLPVEEINVHYNVVSNEPDKVEMIKRSLIKKMDIINEGVTMISIPDKGDFYVKEDRIEFLYKSIQHDVTKSLPVKLSDRITKDAENNYVPVGAYKDYNITFN